jgi:hypothetical protein
MGGELADHSKHLTNEELFLYAKGVLKATPEVADHLGTCSYCMKRFLYAVDVCSGNRSSINPDEFINTEEGAEVEWSPSQISQYSSAPPDSTDSDHAQIISPMRPCLTKYQLLCEVTRVEQDRFPEYLHPHLEDDQCPICSERYTDYRVAYSTI